MIRRPKIAIFIDWFEPGFKAGGPIRSIANFIHHLGDTYEIYIITSDRDIDDLKSYEGVSTDNWIDRHEYKVFYASPGGLNFSSIKRLLQQISPDWIYVNGMFSWTYSILPVLVRTFFYKKASILLAPRGMLKESALKFKPAKKKIFLAIFNAIYVRSNVIFQATDAGEKLDIACIFGKNAKTVRLPNFPGIQRNFIPVTDKKRGELRMIFISRIHPIKNLDYLLSILPELDMKIQLTIVGAIEDKVYWQHCHNLISLIDRKVSIIIKEDVPHAQLESMIIGHHLFVLPTLGENFGHAIFESLAAGRPVLISDQTPWRNLVIHHAGWDIALTDRSQFKEVIKSIANMDATELNVWCKAAWMYCQSYLSINDFKKEYKELFASKN